MAEGQESSSPSRDSGRHQIKSIGGYELLSRLGRGAMGVVFKARQKSMERIVALKILPPRLARDAKFVERFLREARAAGKLSHPNIVGGIDVGEADGYYYFAMEHVEGETLYEIIKRAGRLEQSRALQIAAQLARALAHAHAHGLVHRDVKPQNVIVTADGTAKLCDLGLASSIEEDQSLTAIGTALGTPHYIAPEQIEGRHDIDGRADLYALGATLYHVLAGKPPFTAPTGAKVMAMHLSDPPPPLDDAAPAVSPALAALVMRLLEKRPDERYVSAEELAEDLEEIAAGGAPARLVRAGARRRTASRARRGSTRKTAAVGELRPGRRWVMPAALAAGVVVLGVVFGLGKNAESTLEPKPPAGPGPPARPKPPEGPKPPGEPRPPAEEAAEKELRELFAYARKWKGDNPGKYEQAISRFEKTAERADELRRPLWAMKARDEVARVEKARKAAADAALQKIALKVKELAARRDYDGAAAAVGPPPPELAVELEPRLEGLRAEVRAGAEKLFGEAFEAARASLAAGEPHRGLQKLKPLQSARYAAREKELAALVRELGKASASTSARLAAQRLAAARAAFGKLLDSFDEAVKKGLGEKEGAFKDACNIAEDAASRGELAPVRERLKALGELAEALALAEKAHSEAWSELAGQEVTVQRAGRKPQRGKVARVIDGRTLEVKVEFRIGTQKASSSWRVKLGELCEADREKVLGAWTPKTPSEYLTAAVKKLAGGDLDGAEKLLGRAGDYPLVARYREKLEIARVGAAEVAARKAWEEIARKAPEKLDKLTAEKLKGLVRAFEKEHSATEFAKGRQEELEELKTRMALALLVKNYVGAWTRQNPQVLGLDGRPTKFPEENRRKISHCGAAYDSKRKLCILYGSGVFNHYRNDMWAYDPARDVWRLLQENDPEADDKTRPKAWATASPPCIPFCYDSARDRYWLYVGRGPDEIWSCNPGTLQWQKGPKVKGVRHMALGYHPPSKELVTPLGFLDVRTGDVKNPVKVKWDLFNSWWPCSGMASGSFVPDERGRFLTFGERGKEEGAKATTCIFDPAERKWEELEPAQSPPGRYVGRMVYHHRLKIWVLFGGGKGEEALSDTWIYAPHLETWLEPEAKEAPPRGGDGAVWYDGAGEQVIYFVQDQTWTLKLRPSL